MVYFLIGRKVEGIEIIQRLDCTEPPHSQPLIKLRVTGCVFFRRFSDNFRLVKVRRAPQC